MSKSKSREYSAWANIKQRCLNPNDPAYESYGGRGITVYKKWIDSFDEFIKDVGNKPSRFHSLDRINNNGNYEPGNVRWATSKEQAANRRSSTNCPYIRTTFYLTRILHEQAKIMCVLTNTNLSKFMRICLSEKIKMLQEKHNGNV